MIDGDKGERGKNCSSQLTAKWCDGPEDELRVSIS